MGNPVEQIEAALTTVRRVLDALTTRGDNEAAFDLARAQYATSIRTSWPGNLSTLVQPLEKVAGDTELKLSEAERGELRAAAEVLRRAFDQ